MGQIDYVMKWADLATAKADVVASANMRSDLADWLRDHCTEIQVWRNSQDTTDVDGNVVHVYLPGFFVLISVRRRIAAIENDVACQLGLDRDMMNARQPGFVLISNVSPAVLQDIRFQPVFAGMDVPWGGLN